VNVLVGKKECIVPTGSGWWKVDSFMLRPLYPVEMTQWREHWVSPSAALDAENGRILQPFRRQNPGSTGNSPVTVLSELRYVTKKIKISQEDRHIL
jgi:hypothetical protein